MTSEIAGLGHCSCSSKECFSAGHFAVKSPRSCGKNCSMVSVCLSAELVCASLVLIATGPQAPFGGGDGTVGITCRGERMEQ